MVDWSKCPGVEQIPGKVSGAWLFTDTRLPVSSLFENLEAGATVEEFMEWFAPVDEWKVRAVLQYVADSLKAAPVSSLEERYCLIHGTPRSLKGQPGELREVVIPEPRLA